ncbi:MAG: CBS domain-containing protein [Coriobacteriales bacterium]|jgi:Mg2+ transporter MgtE|nr:CBS domain-containing protein [Coriobacteriales bacterium]
MPYLSQMLGRPVIDANNVGIGRISDIAIQTGEIFPRITSLAFRGPSKTPFMVSWRKYVRDFDGERVVLNTASHNIRFSYLQPDELLLARDLLNKQIVDTQGLKVVRVNDLKLSQSGEQLRLVGAEVGILGILRSLAPWLERFISRLATLMRHPLEENIIAWNYMELVDRDLSTLKLSMTHKRLHELHPADVADILEQLDPQQRAKVFEHLDAQQAAETMSELEGEYQTDLIDDLSESEASELLASMEPDDAADIIGDLPYEKAEKLLWLMGVQDSHRIRSLLGYREKTAGGIMTPEFISVLDSTSVAATIEALRAQSAQLEAVNYIYTVNSAGALSGALSLRSLVLASPETQVYELGEHDLITVGPDQDQEEVADIISKYDLLALPVVDESKKLLGIVTVDDALDVLEEEHSEDLQIAGASDSHTAEPRGIGRLLRWLLRRMLWFVLWAAVSLLCVMAGGFGLFAGALALAPFVLLLADYSVSFAISDLLDHGSSGARAALPRLLFRNLTVAVVMSACALLLSFALAGALNLSGYPAVEQGQMTAGASATLPGDEVVTAGSFAGGEGDAEALPFAFARLLLAACLPTVCAAFVVLALSTLVTLYARRRLDKNSAISNTSLTFVVMIVGLIVQFGLTYIFAQLGANI